MAQINIKTWAVMDSSLLEQASSKTAAREEKHRLWSITTDLKPAISQQRILVMHRKKRCQSLSTVWKQNVPLNQPLLSLLLIFWFLFLLVAMFLFLFHRDAHTIKGMYHSCKLGRYVIKDDLPASKSIMSYFVFIRTSANSINTLIATWILQSAQVSDQVIRTARWSI